MPLENGENAFAAMLAAIESAQESVWLSTYIFETDPVGRQFIDALAAAAARGARARAVALSPGASVPQDSRFLGRVRDSLFWLLSPYL